MQIQIRLKQLLDQYVAPQRAITQRIASDLGLHRHTVGKLYRDQVRSPSLEVLGKICVWLQDHGVPSDILPQALLGSRPAELWKAVAESGQVCIYLGMYQQTEPPAAAWQWVSQRDSEVMANVVRVLSSQVGASGHPPQLRIEYVPFRLPAGNGVEHASTFDADKKEAQRIYREIRSQRRPTSFVYIGSQRVNHLVECLVADIFGCQPFSPPGNTGRKVPFYFGYRANDRVLPSCFGGPEKPPGCGGKFVPGTYILDASGKWDIWPYKENQEDAGVVLVIRRPGTSQLELAVFGFSGRVTRVLGKYLAECAERFWTPGVKIGDNDVGLYLCRFRFTKKASITGDAAVYAKEPDIVPLDGATVKRCVE